MGKKKGNLGLNKTIGISEKKNRQEKETRDWKRKLSNIKKGTKTTINDERKTQRVKKEKAKERKRGKEEGRKREKEET